MKTSKLMKILSFLIFSLSIQSLASIEFKDYLITNEVKWRKLALKDISTLQQAFESPSKKSTFTIREFNYLKEKSLKKNVHTWLIDYNSYGFKITQKTPLKLNKITYGYLIKAVHKSSKKIFKQYISIKNNKLVTLTCQSNKVNNEFIACGNSLNSFSWKK